MGWRTRGMVKRAAAMLSYGAHMRGAERVKWSKAADCFYVTRDSRRSCLR